MAAPAGKPYAGPMTTGRGAADAAGVPRTIDELLGEGHFSERHERRVQAPAAAVWAALHEVRVADLALTRALMGLRTLPARIRGRPGASPRARSARLLDEAPVAVLFTDPERMVLAGSAMQPWRLTLPAPSPALDGPGLRAFAAPGWVKVGMDFVLEPEGEATRVRTETRVVATDPRTREVFGLYWLAIRPGSGLIRRDVLRAIARRAEATGPRTRPGGAG